MRALSNRSTSAPSNLPVRLTEFVGREGETREVESLLGGTRMITLIGSGGCGKTRLALQLAEKVAGDYPDGVWWVDLAPISDPDLLPSAVASVLSIREVPLQDLVQTLKERLRKDRALIVLDNCEHLAEACATAARSLLQSCESLNILATSRAPIGVEGEVGWRVPSLPFPAEDEDLPAEALWGYDALWLFAERAAAVRPDFSPTAEDARAVARICAQLDGMPLAIELAAARVSLMTPDEIAEGLKDRFALLTSGRRTALPREQTLKASVDWSYNLLGEEEQKLLQGLSVFSGGFTLEAASDVVMGDAVGRDRIVQIMSQLVEKSLVQAETGGRKTRYRLLETIRAYADLQLAPAEKVAVEDRHLAYFLRLAERIGADIETSGTADWMPVLDAELDNFRAAMDHAAATGRHDDALAIATWLWVYWMERNRFGEARSRIQTYLGSDKIDGPLKARALSALGGFSLTLGDPATAREAGEECLSICDRIGEKRIRARTLYILSWMQTFTDLSGTRPKLEESVALGRETGDSWWLAMALSYLGFMTTVEGRRDDAQRVFEEVEDLRSINPLADLRALAFEGFGATCWGDLDHATARLNEGVTLARDLDDQFHLAWCLTYLGGVYMYRGDHGQAREILTESTGMSEALGVPILHTLNLTYLAFLSYTQGDLAEAEASLATSTTIVSALGFDYPLITNEWLASEIALARGDLGEATERATKILDQPGSQAYPLIRASLLLVVGEAERRRGASRRAEQVAHEALDVAFRSDSRLGGIDCLELLGGLATLQGSPHEGTRLLAAADQLRRTTGYARFPVRAQMYDEDLRSARRELGDDAFEKEWPRGAELSWEEAVRYASRSRGPRKRPSAGWESLTPTELEVVGLVSEGLTNPQIGERMFISKRTVQAHLSRVFAKLGVSSRSELAARTAQRQI